MNNPFEYIPDSDCREAFQKLLVRLESLKSSVRSDDVSFMAELEKGKMLGVLIAVNDKGNRHTLYAFSGQIGKEGFYFPGFVGPVFDYLQPDGYFKTKEADIIRQNEEIAEYESGELATAISEYISAKTRLESAVNERRENYRQSKRARDEKRDSGQCSETELAQMIRQSQFEKAELHRLKKKVAAELAPLESSLKETEKHLEKLKEKRRRDSENLQDWLFSNFKLLNAYGEEKSLKDIFAATAQKTPPSGAGECCAPKLLQEAYRRGLKPESIAEYWYGRPNGGEVRIHGSHYAACQGKCRPVLGWMMRGLEVCPPFEDEHESAVYFEPEIIYENDWFCVVDKPSGMLSVPGKRNEISVEKWLQQKYGIQKGVKVAHRLDQDTSGLLIATFGELAYKEMQSLFARRRVTKKYVAILEGDYKLTGMSKKGRIDLPLSPDWFDRPRQRVDFKDGKDATTDYEFVDTSNGRSRVNFYPHTGRTHQLRVHAASCEGLGMPIIGDRLYSAEMGHNSQRMYLHAEKIEFHFPLDRRQYSFESPSPF